MDLGLKKSDLGDSFWSSSSSIDICLKLQQLPNSPADIKQEAGPANIFSSDLLRQKEVHFFPNDATISTRAVSIGTTPA